MKRKTIIQSSLFIVAALWAVGVGVGLKILGDYSNTPGATASSPTQWPKSTQLSLQKEQATLIMFAHPHCFCTRASLTELEHIMQKAKNNTAAWIVFLQPQGVEQGWEKTESWQMAQRIPNAMVITDTGGVEAARFGALTSGYTLLYNSEGKLIFSGGITLARGHAGDNAGERRVLSLLETGQADQHSHSVFGCPLHEGVSR